MAYLVDIFERTWERARPFTNRETSMMRDIAAEQRAMTIRMLIEGHADPVSAKRLGVSPRTYAGYVADLKAEYEAETRFQLGYTMGQQGVSGNEGPGRRGAHAQPAQLLIPERDDSEIATRAVTWVTALVLLRRAGGWHWDRTLGGGWSPSQAGVGQGSDRRGSRGNPSWCPSACAGAPEKTDAHRDGGDDDADLADDLHGVPPSSVDSGPGLDPWPKSEPRVHKSAVDRWVRNLHCIFLQSERARRDRATRRLPGARGGADDRCGGGGI